MSGNHKPKLTIFHCINAFDGELSPSFTGDDAPDIQYVKMACSSMVRDIFLLRAFESGSDAVVVLVCPEKACRYIEGSIRSRKRVAWVKGLLDEIGIGSRRLCLCQRTIPEVAAMEGILTDALSLVAELGPNPVGRGDRT